MSGVSLSENQQVVTLLLEYLNGLPSLPAPILLEQFSDEFPALMLQQLSGTVKIKQDILGGYTAQFPFAIYARVVGNDTASRILATGTLNNIGRELEQCTLSSALPVLGADREATRIELRSFPNIISANEDGTEDYQAVFMLEYTQKAIL